MQEKVIISKKYYIKPDGKVYRNSDDSEFVPCIDNDGYYQLCIKGYKSSLLHRIIAEAFIPNPNNKPCVDHINRIRTDNRVENLRWCTKTENNRNTKRTLPEGERYWEMDKKEYKRLSDKRCRKNKSQ